MRQAGPRSPLAYLLWLGSAACLWAVLAGYGAWSARLLEPLEIELPSLTRLAQGTGLWLRSTTGIVAAALVLATSFWLRGRVGRRLWLRGGAVLLVLAGIAFVATYLPATKLQAKLQESTLAPPR